MWFITIALVAYLIGSIPTAVWLGRLKYGLDVREHGSRNAGATNTFRVLGKRAGIVVLLIDVAKGALAVLIPSILAHFFAVGIMSDELIQLQIIASILAVTGHVFPVYVGFRGGKGVATSLGVIIGLQPFAALICFGIFLVVFLTSKYVSLGAITAAFFFPFIVRFVCSEQSSWLLVFSVVLSCLVIIAHRKNITRLIRKEESKMNLFKKQA
jgi:glycerol-3-phosphate acyltransferase PlsY